MTNYACCHLNSICYKHRSENNYIGWIIVISYFSQYNAIILGTVSGITCQDDLYQIPSTVI